MMTISYALKTPEYVLSVGRLDYYNREGSGLDSFGFWYGTGAEALGLTGKVDPDTLRNLFRGMSVDGSTAMVRNAGHKDRQGGWDLTFSIPKSFSVAWAIGSKEERQAIEAAHIAGVEKALAEIERLAGWTRLPGSKGKEFEKVRLTFARFMHGTSRESDPDLHTHCLLINVGLLANGQTAFVYTRDLFRMKMLAGLIYRQTVAHEVRKSLGYELSQKRTWMEIAGIPEEVCHWFSKRRQQVLEHMAARGRTDAKSAAEAAKATRRGKESIPREELHTRWREIAQRALGFAPEILASLRKPYRRSKEPMRLHQAIDSLLKERSHFTERQFLRRVLELSQAAGHSYDAILKGVRRAIPGLVDLGVHNRERYLTTHSVYREEKLLMEKAARGRESTGHLVPERRIRRAGKALSESQREALHHIAGKPGQMVVLQGLAGTGKSSLLAAAKTVWKDSGYRVLGGAYSGKAAQGLEESSKIQSHTVDRLLNQWSKAQSAVRPLDARTVLVIDEAGMIDTDKMHRLFNAVLKAGAKLVLVGDEKQLPPVFGSAPFAMLGQELGRSELTEIRRQRNPLLRHIVEELAEGSPKSLSEKA
jgi:conjugative relaxase-like TrwC/TraI family protein